MSAAILMMGMMGSCVSSAAMFYTCSNGTLSLSNLNANNCLSFLNSNCTANVTETPVSVRCRYVEVLQEQVANVIHLQDISVYSVGGAKLTGTVLSATGLSGTALASFADDDSTTATYGLTVDAPGTAKDSVIVDLGQDREVHKIVLKNTNVAGDKDKICGAKVRLLRPKYVDETSTETYIDVYSTSTTITKVGDLHTFKIMSDASKSVWS